MKIILASTNAGKIKEFQSLLKPYQIEIISQQQANVPEIEETGLTFVENALLKARHAAEASGLPALADDSGLEVPALMGAPGIYSARYAGQGCTSADNIKKLLKELEQIPDTQRQAAYHCVLVYMQHAKDPRPLICEGSWSGIILKEPRGDKGFGYDPIFFDPLQNASAAELPSILKNKISHRGQAMEKFLQQLPVRLKEGQL